MADIDAQPPAPARRTMAVRLKDALRPFQPWLPAGSARLSWRRSLRALQHHGFQPATVFDIGVGFGTWELYRAFPKAFYHLIEPAREARPYMEKLARRLHCDIHPVALGDCEGDARLEIRADIQGSTLLEEVGPREVLRFDRVPMRRFDSLIGEITRPTLCKIDVQGAELMVLRGMTARIAEIDVLIVETSTLATVRGGAEVHAVVQFMHDHGFALAEQFMHDHGFALADIVGLKHRPLDNATAQLDLMFVPEQSPQRADRRWTKSA